MFRKQSPVTQSNEDISKRISSVDNIALNKERKNLFNQIETQDAEYYPFGTPGGGAPLRNSKNDLVSRLPNINENLWIRNPQVTLENKKQEIHSIIDKYTQKKQNEVAVFDGSGDPFFAQRRHRYAQIQVKLDPVKRSHIRPESYWNDWFGRPGAGAPNRSYYKQNLDEMLEPQFQNKRPSIDSIEPYNPSTSSLIQKRLRSDHHNRYELTPR